MVRRTIQDLQRRISALRLPKPLLLNNVDLSQAHLKAVLKEVEVEQQWYKDVPPFQSLAQILSAYGTGRLVKVESNLDYQPIMRLRNPKLAESYPGYLTPEAKKLLNEIAHHWREQMEAAGLDKAIRLAITSLVRTTVYQRTIVKAGKLASPDSPHTRGVAFDIDASGYYIGETAVNARQGEQAKFHEAFKELGAELPQPTYADYDRYNPAVHELLKQVLITMTKDQKLHFVIEYPGTTNQVFHVCLNPSYQP